MTLTMKELRNRRRAADIAAAMLANEAEITRTRISAFENGHAQPTEDEFRRLQAALERLVSAKTVIQQVAASVGWPGTRVA